MKRLFGLMPKEEVSISRCFIDGFGFRVIIQAGSKGWTVIYADHSNDYIDVVDTPEANFKNAYRVATDAVGSLKLVN